MSATTPLSGRTRVLRDHLLIQVSAADADEIGRLVAREGSGIVMSGARAAEGASRLAQIAPGIAVVQDRRRYAGKSREHGTAAFDPAWLEQQRELGAPVVLSDSGYVGAGDLQSLQSILCQAAEAESDLTAVLPLHTQWLRSDLPTLIREVETYDTPVALVLEHATDPLGVLETVQGLATFLSVARDASLLCSDVSALGAIAFGANWAAVGIRSSLRHLYPAKGGFAGNTTTTNALVDAALALIKTDKIAAAFARTPDDPAWQCHCSVCVGRTMDWFAFAAGTTEANQHNIELLLDRRDSLVGVPAGALRKQSWRAQCGSAEFQYESLAIAGVSWPVPNFLKYWRRV